MYTDICVCNLKALNGQTVRAPGQSEEGQGFESQSGHITE